jgi:quercetin dioxygenase-like cupin family protein
VDSNHHGPYGPQGPQPRPLAPYASASVQIVYFAGIAGRIGLIWRAFKVTGDDTAGAFDYFTVEVAPKGGPPLHVHHKQDETIHVVSGHFKVKIGEETFELAEGGFAYLPSKIPHVFLNLTDEPGELTIVFTPGGAHRFFEELGPAVVSSTNRKRASERHPARRAQRTNSKRLIAHTCSTVNPATVSIGPKSSS